MMTSPELDNLVRQGQLKREQPTASEIRGLLRSGEARLVDARNPDLSLEKIRRGITTLEEVLRETVR